MKIKIYGVKKISKMETVLRFWNGYCYIGHSKLTGNIKLEAIVNADMHYKPEPFIPSFEAFEYLDVDYIDTPYMEIESEVFDVSTSHIELLGKMYEIKNCTYTPLDDSYLIKTDFIVCEETIRLNENDALIFDTYKKDRFHQEIQDANNEIIDEINKYRKEYEGCRWYQPMRKARFASFSAIIILNNKAYVVKWKYNNVYFLDNLIIKEI